MGGDRPAGGASRRHNLFEVIPGAINYPDFQVFSKFFEVKLMRDNTFLQINVPLVPSLNLRPANEVHPAWRMVWLLDRPELLMGDKMEDMPTEADVPDQILHRAVIPFLRMKLDSWSTGMPLDVFDALEEAFAVHFRESDATLGYLLEAAILAGTNGYPIPRVNELSALTRLLYRYTFFDIPMGTGDDWIIDNAILPLCADPERSGEELECKLVAFCLGGVYLEQWAKGEDHEHIARLKRGLNHARRYANDLAALGLDNTGVLVERVRHLALNARRYRWTIQRKNEAIYYERDWEKRLQALVDTIPCEM